MLSILHKYLLRQNLALMLIILFSGMGIYLIVDFLTRMNAIVESGIPLTTAAMYFIYKTPLIVTQIMPAIFMLAVVIQVALMYRSNEMIALQAHSISFIRPAFFIIAYSVLIFLILLIFSETLGVHGYQQTRLIWDEDIRHRQVQDRGVDHLWFKEGQNVVSVNRAWPERGTGQDIRIYRMDGPDRVKEVIEAGEFSAVKGKWTLKSPIITSITDFSATELESLELNLNTELSSFSVIASRMPYEALSLLTLGNIISQLKESGSNVEKLSTAWHSKIAYAFALVVMTILGLALATLIRNIYALVVLSLVIVFLYYTVYVFGVSYAEEGMLAPFWGAWLANILFGIMGLGQILWTERE